MLEREIEKKLVARIKKLGGLCYKFTSPGNAGVPDRIIVLSGGRIIFTELKTEKGRPTKLQEAQIKRLRKLGAEVRVIFGIDHLNIFLEELENAKCV